MKPGTGSSLTEDQKNAIRKIHALDGKAGLFMEMRTGKTRASLVYTEFRQCRRVLVVCPTTVIGVWQDEAAEIEYSLPVVDLWAAGTVRERAAALRKQGDGLVLINYESYWRPPLRGAIEKWRPDAVIFDEGHRLRHRGSRHSHFAHRLCDIGIPIRLMLTGTPSNNGLQDFWSMYRAVDPRIFGKSYADFAAEYLIIGGYAMREIKGYRHVERASALIARTSYQALATHTHQQEDVRVPVSLLDRTLYDTLRKRAIVEVESLRGQKRQIIARTVLTLLLRLQQTTSGFVRPEDDGPTETVSTEKLDAVKELVADSLAQKRKVVVFARFLHDVESLKTAFGPRVRVAVLVGGQSPGARRKIIADFRDGKYDVVVAQIRVASLGIDLSSASVGIFYSLTFSLDEFLQAKARLLGRHQTRDVTYYHVVARDTVDEKIYKALSKKIDIGSRLTDLHYSLDLLT